MTGIRFFRTTLLAASVALAGSMAAGNALAEQNSATPNHLRGTITRMSDSGFTVRSATDGTTHQVAISDDTRIAGVVPSSLDQISEGTFIGTANVPGSDGQPSRALEMVIFPESMKGAGLGDYPWDMPRAAMNDSSSSGGERMGGAQSGSTMTNGTVTATESSSGERMGGAQSGSTMTNGTVESSSSDSGMMTLTVDYGDGSKKIQVPHNVPTVKVQQATMDDLRDGRVVFVAGDQSQSPIQAKVVIVGLEGAEPPM